MTVIDIMSIINFVILIGFTVLYCCKGQKKSAIVNLAVFILFVSVHIVDYYYIDIRHHLYEALGENAFNVLKSILKVCLFFGSSITVSIQILIEVIDLFVILYFATKVIKVLRSRSNKNFSASILPENEKVINKFDVLFTGHYLVLERMLN